MQQRGTRSATACSQQLSSALTATPSLRPLLAYYQGPSIHHGWPLPTFPTVVKAPAIEFAHGDAPSSREERAVMTESANHHDTRTVPVRARTSITQHLCFVRPFVTSRSALLFSPGQPWPSASSGIGAGAPSFGLLTTIARTYDTLTRNLAPTR